MIKVVQYKDDNGRLWDTEEAAIFSDAKNKVKCSLERHINNGRISVGNWAMATKEDAEVIRALLYILELDDTKIAVDRIMRQK
jgi:hypothetical protein